MAQTSHTNPPPLSPKDLRRRIKSAYDSIRTFVESQGNERLRSLWPEWNSKFHQIFDSTEHRPEIAISLVGGTGSGKSTLVNALIGARVLPVSNMRACTAAICEVGYDPERYRARIEFVSRESWENEVGLLLADLRDFQAPQSDPVERDRHDTPAQMSKAVRDKLWTVYRRPEDSSSAEFDPFNFEEPVEIRDALDSGVVEIASQDLPEFRKSIARYLDSQHSFWPIVKRVAINGRFPPLQDGAKLVDLPGVNDPNDAREEVTRSHLKTCRFVWLVFNIKRALTRDAIGIIGSDDFLRQVVMDGRSDALTFVGTAADDVDLETGIEEFRLPDDSMVTQVVAARNKAVRKVVYGQLDELAFRLGEMAREDKATATKLATRLQGSKIFTVSAREFLRLNGVANTTSAGFDDVSQTELPSLVSHMRNICAAYGVSAHCASLHRQLQNLIAEIKSEAQAQQAQLKSRAEVSERGQEELRAAVKAAQTFLERDLGNAKEHLVQALEADQSLLSERVKRAVDQARRDLEQTVSRWHRMNWGTIRAACRRDGSYVGVNGRTDFPSDLSKPILDGIAFAWSDFFGEQLIRSLEHWTDRLVRIAGDCRNRLGESLSESSEVSQSMTASVDGIFETSERVVREILSQTKVNMEGKIRHEQRTLYESIPQRVKVNMQSAFDEAAKESGSGMKQRMVEILAKHAHRVAQVMFDDARDALLSGVRGLNDWLAREFDKMIDSVHRNVSLVATNLVAEGPHMTLQIIEAEQTALADLMTLIDGLDEPSE